MSVFNFHPEFKSDFRSLFASTMIVISGDICSNRV